MSFQIWALDAHGGQGVVTDGPQWYLVSLDNAWSPIPLQGYLDALHWAISHSATTSSGETSTLEEACLEVSIRCRSCLDIPQTSFHDVEHLFRDELPSEVINQKPESRSRRAMLHYEDFSLLIESPYRGAHPIVVQSPAGEGRGELRLPFGTEFFGISQEALSDARDLGAPPLPVQPRLSLEEVGRSLFEALFSGQVRDLFERSLGLIESDPERGLRIVLRFDPDQPEVGRLTALPWESLYRKDQRQFLNFSRKSPIVRFLNVPRALPPRLEPPVRVLVAIASPSGYPLLDTERELHRIEEALGPIAGASKAVLLNATPEALRARLLEETFHVLHFIGHGTFDTATGQGALVFEDGEGHDRPVPGPVMADLLRDFSSLRLIFLNACRTAALSSEMDPYAGLAAALVMAGVPAVLGMQIPISDHAAIAFSGAFYQRLAAGDPIDTATVEGRMAVHLKDPESQEWATPVLFLRSSDGRLFDPPPTPTQVGISPEIRAGIIDDSRYVNEKTNGFVGRKWLFDSIGGFLQKNPRGYFILRGDPGIGKSAFLAQMVRREGYIHHFNVRAEGIRSPETFLSNVCSQIIATYGLDHTFLPPEAKRDARFLNSLLDKVSAQLKSGEKAVILVDALDEADASELIPGANPLYLPLLLPPGVFMVLTTRREPLGLRIECEQQTLDIEQDSDGNVADVREFVESKLSLPGIRAYILSQGLDDASFVAHLVERSQGNFMYLRYVLPEIENGFYKDRDFTDLPEGLQNYYQNLWRRMRSRDEAAWFDYQLPVLVALTVIKEPISMDLIQKFSGVEDRRRIRVVLNEWEPLLFTASADDEDGQIRKRYRLYHASFHDFVAAKDEVADERVNLKAANARIADVLLEGMYG